MSVTIAVRPYMSGEHLESAAFFARNCRAIEKGASGPVSDETRNQHRAYVIGTVLTSVAALDATINELFADCVDHPTGSVSSLGSEATSMMAAMWSFIAERFSILGKFEVALILNKKTPFDKGAAPYQDALSLIQLRNTLVHYKPEWIISVSPVEVPHQFEKRLAGKFALNPLTGAGNPFYPDKCLGHGCAKWAVVTSIALINGFYSKIGMSPPYNPSNPRLQPE